MRIVVLNITLVLAAALVVGGCKKTMKDSGRIKPLGVSDFFADGRSARGIQPGTVARDALSADVLIPAHSKPPATDTYPFEITDEVLHRGRERFNIYCSVCHGYLGDGKGMVVQRGFTPPPSFHIPRLRDQEPDKHFYDVISNGWGAMYSYGDRVKPDDRWAIIAYIRALQLSQHAPAELATAAANPSTPKSEK